MAGSDPQKQLLTIIRDFATEKSQGERRVVGLKQRVQELRSELDAANAELEDAKRCRETTEQKLKGYEVELALNDTSIQTLEARINPIQDDISTVGSELEALKNEEGASRDEFINQMFEFNTKIRKFHETLACTFQKKNRIGTSSDDGTGHKIVNEQDTEVDSRTVQDTLSNIIAQTNMEEQEYQAEQNIHKQVQQELIDFERKVSLMEAIMKETKELQELTRYPFQKLHWLLLIGLVTGSTLNKENCVACKVIYNDWVCKFALCSVADKMEEKKRTFGELHKSLGLE